MFRVAVAGCGGISRVHFDALKKLNDINVVAACDVNPSKSVNILDGCRFYTDYNEMISQEPLDVIHICTPHYLHAPMTITALNKGINVLTEKPMAIGYNDALDMVEAAKINNKTLGVIFQNRFNKGSQLVKNALDTGRLGKIIGGNLFLTWNRDDDYYLKSGWRGTFEKEGGGVIINQSIHSFDLINWFVNDEVMDILVDLKTRTHNIEVEDCAEGLILYRNGTKISFYTNLYNSYDAPIEINLHCENGKVKILSDSAVIYYNDGTIVTDKNEDIESIGKDYWGNRHLRQIEEYYQAINESRQPYINGETALAVQKLICKIYEKGRIKQ